MEVRGVVPAKANSSRLPGKNGKRLGELPLFLNAAAHLARVLPREYIFIDSDSPGYLEEAQRFGFSILERPEHLADNGTSGIDLMRWEFEAISSADVLIQHFPTMPFLSLRNLELLVGAVTDKGYDSAFLTQEFREYLWLDHEKPMYDLDRLPNSVELTTYFRECMGVYVCSRKSFEQRGNRISGKTFIGVADHLEMVDIDYRPDLEFARVVLAGLAGKGSYIGALEPTTPKGNGDFQAVFMDVDGTLTSGRLTVDSEGNLSREYNVLDGKAIKDLPESIPVFWVTAAEEDPSIAVRAMMLGVTEVFYGVRDKLALVEGVLARYSLDLPQIVYIGDEEADRACLERAGAAFIPADSKLENVRRASRTLSKGGRGAVAEALQLSGLS